MRVRGHTLAAGDANVRAIYITGSLFFGSIHAFLEAFGDVPRSAKVILSMRGVPSVDAMGVPAIEEIVERQHRAGGEVYLSRLQPKVRSVVERSGVHAVIGDERIHWSADHPIVALHAERAEPVAIAAG